jgi:putative oxygen-independent coproporphyrinogen III oxidase
MASIYVHFPYCLEKCPYCDFVSYKAPASAIPHAAYADAVIREAQMRAPSFVGRKVLSVFFGGGTPSLWETGELARTLAQLREIHDIAPEAEVTVECNPTSLTAAKVRALSHAGVNRLSIGVQSLKPSELSYLGREHSPEGALAALRAAVSEMPRVSGDLIFGLPEQSIDQGSTHAEALVDLGLKHLSAYQLTIEAGTRFGELARAGRLPLADDARVAEAFLHVSETLTARGFRHYEISNYALPGEESQHNLAYWHGAEYMGLGCGAVGFTRNHSSRGGHRWRNEIKPERYIAHEAQSQDFGGSVEVLTSLDLLKERIMLGLRLAGGLDLEQAGADLGVDPWSDDRRRAIKRLVEMNRLEVNGTVLQIPRAQWLFADDTAARLF